MDLICGKRYSNGCKMRFRRESHSLSGFIMSISLRQLVRSLTFVLMVMLTAGSATAFDVDSDTDDDYLAVALDLSCAIPSHNTVLPGTQAAGGSKTGSPESRKMSGARCFQSAPSSQASSLPLTIPLRT